MTRIEKSTRLQLQDFVEPQRTGPSLTEQQRQYDRQVKLRALAANPATVPQRAYELRRLAGKSAKRNFGGLRRANARSLPKLQDAVIELIGRGLREGVLGERANFVTREAIARRLAVPEHQVEQVFARLVREGLLLRQPNTGAHDTIRNAFFGGPATGWAPTYWRLRNLARWREMLSQSL